MTNKEIKLLKLIDKYPLGSYIALALNKNMGIHTKHDKKDYFYYLVNDDRNNITNKRFSFEIGDILEVCKSIAINWTYIETVKDIYLNPSIITPVVFKPKGSDLSLLGYPFMMDGIETIGTLGTNEEFTSFEILGVVVYKNEVDNFLQFVIFYEIKKYLQKLKEII